MKVKACWIPLHDCKVSVFPAEKPVTQLPVATLRMVQPVAF